MSKFYYKLGLWGNSVQTSWLKSTKWLCSVKTDSHFVLCRTCSNSSHLKSAVTMWRSFHYLIAQQFSKIFSAGCYFSDYAK